MAEADDPALHIAVRAIINKRDPEGLLEIGAPEDEYDSEVADLVTLVKGSAPITADAVAAIFDRWFGIPGRTTGDRDKLAEVAGELEALRKADT